MAVAAVPTRDPDTNENRQLVAVLDQMIELSESKRREIQGVNFFQMLREFYNFHGAPVPLTPTFRPNVRLADLQMLTLQEASDLTENSPVIFVSRQDKRHPNREEALRAVWQRGQFNNQIMYAIIWALMAGTGFTENFYDPTGNYGRGACMIRARDPETVFPDPWARAGADWEYVNVRIPMTVDEMARKWPEHMDLLKYLIDTNQMMPRELAKWTGQNTMEGSARLELPPGAMRSVPIGTSASGKWGYVDWMFLRDSTEEEVKDRESGEQLAKALSIPALKEITVKRRPKYPAGRLIIRVARLIFYDGPNFMGPRFPITPIFGMPPLYGVWSPPPMRYVFQLQQVAEIMLSQTVENAVRLNNGIMVINRTAGIKSETIQGLPGEVIVVDNPGTGQPVSILTPPQFPSQMIDLPKFLMDKMRDTMGFGPNRQGQSQPGNISANLFDSAVAQGQSITRLRSRMLAQSIEEIAQLTFYQMLRFLGDMQMSLIADGEFDTVEWDAVAPDEQDKWDVTLDANSIKPMGIQSIRNLALLLKREGLIDPEHALKWLQVPEHKEIAAALQNMQQMQALIAQGSRGQQRKQGGV